MLGKFWEQEEARSRGEGNPRAIQCRMESVSETTAKFRRRHAMRIGKQPDYVDTDRSELNSVLMPYPTPAAARREAEALYRLHEPTRKMQKNAPAMCDGIVTFGHEASAWIAQLHHDTQNAMFHAVVHAVCERFNLGVRGIVVHRDETSLHAHFAATGRTLDGVTTAARAIDGRVVQDIAAEIAAQYEPRIERGYSSKSRREAGASPADVRHKSVRELHETEAEDLSKRLDGRRQELEELNARVSEAEAKAAQTEERLDAARAKLEAAGGEEQKLLKRVQTYEARLLKQQEEVSKLEAEREARQAAAEDRAAAMKLLDDAQEEREKASLEKSSLSLERAELAREREEVKTLREKALNLGHRVFELVQAVAERLGVGPKLAEVKTALEALEAPQKEPETFSDMFAQSKLAREKSREEPGSDGPGL